MIQNMSRDADLRAFGTLRNVKNRNCEMLKIVTSSSIESMKPAAPVMEAFMAEEAETIKLINMQAELKKEQQRIYSRNHYHANKEDILTRQKDARYIFKWHVFTACFVLTLMFVTRSLKPFAHTSIRNLHHPPLLDRLAKFSDFLTSVTLLALPP